MRRELSKVNIRLKILIYYYSVIHIAKRDERDVTISLIVSIIVYKLTLRRLMAWVAMPLYHQELIHVHNQCDARAPRTAPPLSALSESLSVRYLVGSV